MSEGEDAPSPAVSSALFPPVAFVPRHFAVASGAGRSSTATMLAGLIFATEDAEDRPEMLAATLPFCGSTLIEYQARLLAEAGATHLLVAVGRVTPALLGAASRIGKRGLSVDLVRSAEEAAARAHPLARLLVVADGLVTTEEIVRLLAGEGGDAVLASTAPGGGERIDSGSFWAGLARLGAGRLADAAAMPGDYDFQSVLLRQTVADGAELIPLPADAGAAGHGVVRSGAVLARRSNAVVAALAGGRIPWADRWVLGPIARLAVPPMVARGVPEGALLVAGGGLGLAACLLALIDWWRIGLALALLAVALLSAGSLLSWLGAAERLARWQDRAGQAVAAATVVLAGSALTWETATGTPLTLALVLVAAAALAERAARFATRRRWWGSPAGYLLVLLGPVLLGWPLTGFAVATVYAGLTLADAIERGRRHA